MQKLKNKPNKADKSNLYATNKYRKEIASHNKKLHDKMSLWAKQLKAKETISTLNSITDIMLNMDDNALKMLYDISNPQQNSDYGMTEYVKSRNSSVKAGKLFFIAILLSSIITNAGCSQIVDDIKNNKFLGKDLDKHGFTAQKNNIKIMCVGDNSPDTSSFGGADKEFFNNNLGHVQNFATNEDLNMARFSLKLDEQDNIPVSLTIDRNNTDSNYPLAQKLHEDISETILPTLAKLTHRGIYFGGNTDKSNNINIVILENDKYNLGTNYAAMGDGQLVVYPKEYNITSREFAPEYITHELLHSFGFAHPFKDTHSIYKDCFVSRNGWGNNLFTPKYDVNTIMSYSAFDFSGIYAAHFDYILDPKNNISQKLSEKTANGIKTFVETYREALEIGLTPIDIAEIESQFAPAEYANQAVNMIKDTGIENFIFERLDSGLLKFEATSDTLDFSDVSKYCKQNDKTNAASECHANINILKKPEKPCDTTRENAVNNNNAEGVLCNNIQTVNNRQKAKNKLIYEKESRSYPAAKINKLEKEFNAKKISYDSYIESKMKILSEYYANYRGKSFKNYNQRENIGKRINSI